MKRVAVLLILFSTTSCKQKVGGPCTYREVNYKMGIVELIKSDENLEFVVLGTGDDASVRQYKFSAADLEDFDLDFESLQKEKKQLDVSMEEIVEGSCTPYMLKNIKPL